MVHSSPIPWTAPPRLNPVWRLGHKNGPCHFPPRERCGWRNRFDDPQHRYRTLYAARESITCLRELLADLRPNPKAVAELDSIFGKSEGPSLTIAGVVSSQWRRLHVLVKASIHPDNERLVSIESRRTLKALSRDHSSLLAGFGIKSLNSAHVRTRERIITQQFSRSLYDAGYGGVSFNSRLDGKPCYAMFEGRMTLRPMARPTPLTDDSSELIRVCGEYNLILRPGRTL